MQHPYASFGIIVLIILLLNFIYTYATKFEKIITIKKVDNIKLSSKYLSNVVSDDKGEIFTVKNNGFLLFFKAPELYESLEVGKRYKIKGYGRRIPILGLYQHIYDAQIV